tara:strand:+ start:1464 stop:1832 length:369 start_codon:yes stop_codon:yes gene_type:complete
LHPEAVSKSNFLDVRVSRTVAFPVWRLREEEFPAVAASAFGSFCRLVDLEGEFDLGFDSCLAVLAALANCSICLHQPAQVDRHPRHYSTIPIMDNALEMRPLTCQQPRLDLCLAFCLFQILM